MPYTIPPDTRALYTGNPPADMNDVADVLTGNPGILYNVLNTAFAGGADPTGAADSTAAIQAAISAVIYAGGGVVYVPMGRYKVISTLTASGNIPVYIVGDGLWASVIMFYGSGDCLRVYDPTIYVNRAVFGGGATLGLTIDGTHHTGTGASGLHMGDIEHYKLDVGVQNFTAAGDIGVHLDNQYYWTEQLQGDIFAMNCTSHLVFDVSGATTSTGSFARINLNCSIDQIGPSFTGVVLQNGAFIYDGKLAIRGNFGGSSSALTGTPAVLTLTGSAPGGHVSSSSEIFASQLDIQAECEANTYTPQTILFGSPGANSVRGCYGVMDFGLTGTTFSQSNIAGTPAALWFTGTITGDLALCPANVPFGSGSLPAISGSMLYAKAYSTGTGSIYSYSGDFFQLTLTANATIALGAEFGYSPGAPQRLTIVVTQAAAASYTVTWPHAGSPTTTSPAVLWAGGTAPAMTSTHGATDVYKLETIDGAHWYGQALQNVS